MNFSLSQRHHNSITQLYNFHRHQNKTFLLRLCHSMIYHKTVANLNIFVCDIEQDQLVGPRFEGVIVTRSAHCDMNWATDSSSQTLIWIRDHAQITSSNAKNIRVHSLGRHRQQLASCATLWRLFPTRDREHELSFLLLFVFSLRKRKKCGERRRRQAAQHNCSAERKIECWEMKLWKIFFSFFFFVAVHNFSQAPRARNAHKFPHFQAGLSRGKKPKWKGVRARSLARRCRAEALSILHDTEETSERKLLLVAIGRPSSVFGNRRSHNHNLLTELITVACSTAHRASAELMWKLKRRFTITRVIEIPISS